MPDAQRTAPPSWSVLLDSIETWSKRIVPAAAKRGVAVALAAICLTAIVWPFFIDAGHLLYVRYFDAETYFDPVGKLLQTLSAWDFSQHLGAPSGRAMMYASLPGFIYAAVGFAGPNVLVRGTCVVAVAACFAAMLAYLRYAYEPRPPLAAQVFAALFFAGNPYVVSLVHDGFVTLLGQYVLLPASLAALEWGKRARRPEVLVGVALAFVLESLYTVPLVVIDVAAILALQGSFVLWALRDRRTRTGLGLLTLSQTYWVVPLLVEFVLHAGLDTGAETAGDVNLTATYASLTNVVLLRSYPSIWTSGLLGARECTVCAYYASAQFALPMLALAAAASFALYREGRIRLLVLCGTALVLATSVRYAGEFIGLPYELLMHVPPLDSVFRGAVKFDQVAAFVYALGIASFLRDRGPGPYPTVAKLAVAIATIFVTAPLWTGGLIERGTHLQDRAAVDRYLAPSRPQRPREVIAFPNFPVEIPPEYARLRDELRNVPRDQAILVLPNQPFAAYAWGAYGNDFVPAAIGHATLEATYVPQPSFAVDEALRSFSDPAFDKDSAASFLSVFRLGTIVYRGDALGAPSAPLSALGRVVKTDGSLSILRAALPPIAASQSAARPVQVAGNQEAIVRFAAFAGAMTRSLDPGACSAKDPIGLADPTTGSSIDAFVATGCDAAVRLEAATSHGAILGALTPAQGGTCPVYTGPLRTLVGVPSRGVFVGSTSGQIGQRGTCVHLRFHGRFRYAALEDTSNAVASARTRDDPVRSPWPGVWVASAQPESSVRSYNVASDRVIAGMLFAGGRFAGFANKFVPYTYANGYYVPAGDSLAIVNLAMLAGQLGGAISLAAFFGLAFWLAALVVPRRHPGRT